MILSHRADAPHPRPCPLRRWAIPRLRVRAKFAPDRSLRGVVPVVFGSLILLPTDVPTPPFLLASEGERINKRFCLPAPQRTVNPT